MGAARSQTRRRFLKDGLAVLGGASLLPHGGVAGPGPMSGAGPSPWPLRALGETGLRLPRLSMGCAQATDPGLIEAALEAGIVHFDTAAHYANGTNERLLGRALAGRPRDSFIVATKIIPDGEDQSTGLFTERTAAAPFLAKFERSVQRLGLEFVDILYLHQASRAEAALFDPLLRALDDIKRSGRARWIGVSTHQREPEVIRAAAGSGVYDVVLTSYNFRQPHAAAVREAIGFAASKGLGVIAMKALAGVYWDAERRQPIDAAAALKWVLSDPHVDTCLAGFSTLDQLRVGLQALREPDFTDRDRAALRLDTPEGPAGLYCSQCGACRNECLAKEDVPTWMRGYMYAVGYRTPARAKVLLGSSLARPFCGSCAECTVRCPMGIDVRSRILDLARLSEVPDVFLA